MGLKGRCNLILVHIGRNLKITFHKKVVYYEQTVDARCREDKFNVVMTY